MNVREAGSQDAIELARLLSEFDEDSTNQRSAGSMESFLGHENGEVVLVAELENRLVGFATIQITDSVCYTRPTAEITGIFVSAEERRTRLGTELIKSAIRKAEEANVLEVFLRVNTENPEAIQFYESCGLEKANHVEYRIIYYGSRQRADA